MTDLDLQLATWQQLHDEVLRLREQRQAVEREKTEALDGWERASRAAHLFYHTIWDEELRRTEPSYEKCTFTDGHDCAADRVAIARLRGEG